MARVKSARPVCPAAAEIARLKTARQQDRIRRKSARQQDRIRRKTARQQDRIGAAGAPSKGTSRSSSLPVENVAPREEKDRFTGEGAITKEECVAYLKEVKETFKDDVGSYKQFLKLMGDMQANKLDASTVIIQAKKLFQGHEPLILGFNKFLPAGQQSISPPEMEQSIIKPVPSVRKRKGSIKDKHEEKSKKSKRKNDDVVAASLPKRVSPRNTERNVPKPKRVSVSPDNSEERMTSCGNTSTVKNMLARQRLQYCSRYAWLWTQDYRTFDWDKARHDWDEAAARRRQDSSS